MPKDSSNNGLVVTFEGMVQVNNGAIYCKLHGSRLHTDDPVIVVFPGRPGLNHEVCWMNICHVQKLKYAIS